AGAFKALYEKITKEDKENGNEEERPLFDIIAGTSIGAINAAVLVSYVIENKTWRGSPEKLIEFWEYLSCPTPDITKISADWKKVHDKNNPNAASAEAARRYYSVKEFLKSGVDKVYSPILPPKVDEKFFDQANKRSLYSKQPLQKSIEKFVKFPLATDYKNGEPRLLVVSTDVAAGIPVTFDSYEKGKDLNGKEIRNIVYNIGTSQGEEKKQQPQVIEYNNGINIQHIMASASLPEFYEYEEIGGRKFWDGGILSNTPIRELIQAHKDFWEYKIGSKELENSILEEASFNVPDLEIYIVNLVHSDDNVVPSDPDGITERHKDIKLHDQYYVKESILLTHYTDLIEKLIQLVKSKNNNNNNYGLKNDINRILQNYAVSIDITEIPKKYLEIIKTQFEITRLETIERRDDHDTISAKDGDFTSETINKLIKDGYESAWRKFPQFMLQHRQQKD
ncbi:MAG TPA: patatin-like phospholipase family protein, partial [Nitrososphaeraceae archaeon]|nr:patatin-like phospholipase family protein [Nitrososphaeraceae archaeon]